MTRLTKQGVRDLNNIGGAPRPWPRSGRSVSALEQCLASDTHRMVHVRDEPGPCFTIVEHWQCRTCGTVEQREIFTRTGWY
jgi:hypothetical protein